QENIWAEQLTCMGHAVRLFVPGSVGKPKLAQEGGHKYEIQNVPTIRMPRHTYWSRTVHTFVADYQPDLMILFGDKLFMVKLCRENSLAGVPMVSTFSENLGMHEFDWNKPGLSIRQRLWALGFAALRGGPIRAVCRRSTLIVGNTPQARDILLRLFAAD